MYDEHFGREFSPGRSGSARNPPSPRGANPSPAHSLPRAHSPAQQQQQRDGQGEGRKRQDSYFSDGRYIRIPAVNSLSKSLLLILK